MQGGVPLGWDAGWAVTRVQGVGVNILQEDEVTMLIVVLLS